MARPTLPTRLKILQGTARKGDGADEPKYTQLAPDKFPEPPSFLNADGAALWRDLGGELTATGVLCIVDLYALTSLCYQWQRHLLKMKNQSDITAADANALRQLFVEFGVTPSARRRVTSGYAPSANGQPGTNRFAKFKQQA